jgi:hypothetical protein
MRAQLLFVLVLSILPAAVVHAGCTAPVAVADSADNYGATLVVDVLVNDRDADGDALQVDVTGGTCTGDTIVVSGGLLRIEPANHLPRACVINYRITDTTGRSASSQVQLLPVFLGPIFEDGFESGSTTAWSLTCTTSC